MLAQVLDEAMSDTAEYSQFSLSCSTRGAKKLRKEATLLGHGDPKEAGG